MENIMRKIQKHQRALTEYLERIANERNESLGSIKGYQAITDTLHNHFQLVQITWYKEQFIFQVLMHFQIHPETGNIWVQQNNTENIIDEELAEWDIPKSNLVLGFRPADMRALSPFALA